MDITPTQDSTQQPISDDQELAKALAGVMPDEPEAEKTPTEEPIVVGETTSNDPSAQPAPDPAAMAPADAPAPTMPAPAPETTAPATPANDLDGIKKNALGELRPLIDKVDLPAEEKFDTYLMLIRSTDDTSLIQPAYTAAQSITDEKRKAEALLDIVKEIDYLSRKDKPA